VRPAREVAASLRGQGLKFVSISAQLELILSASQPHLSHGCVLKLPKLSSNAKECKPLPAGGSPRCMTASYPTTGGKQGLTLVHFSALPEPLTLYTSPKRLNTPSTPPQALPNTPTHTKSAYVELTGG